ncbi:LacI family DNA-binding transcriptional regulator [Microbacterium gilvum]|uniref:HTH lacI-type domain-containing protein n=1 Tax=Microbacterium gilvum TaxID=1336204 RepID=A0ABP9A7A8_9MICO
MAAKRARKHPVRETTIQDIAAHAGVSKATVSRVVNGVPTVAEDIAERVRASVAELGYTPSQTARSLSLGVSRTIGVLAPDLANPMFQQVLHGVHRAAAADGYRVLVADTLEDEAGETGAAQDIRNRTDALVLIAPRMTRPELLDLLPRVQPVAVVNRTTGRNAVVAQVDYAAGIQVLARHLVSLGHSRIAFLSGPEASRSNHERQHGLTAFREEHPGIEIMELAGGSSFEHGYDAWEAIRASGATAVIAFNDIVALGLLGRLDEEGVHVPEELSVTGFDDIPFSRFSAPPLTTMTVDLSGVGAAAWRELHAEMTGEERRDPVVFMPVLTVRGSTGPRA